MIRPLPDLGKADLIQDALTYSLAAYESPDDFSLAHKFENDYFSVTALLVSLDDLDVLAFKGSVELRDWTINAQVMPWCYHRRMAHLGFQRAHHAIWNDVNRAIDPKRELLVTGHSLGGGEAELSAFRLKKHRAPVHMITFGKPNVWFLPRKRRLLHLATQLSFVSGSDIVAKLPRYIYGPDPGQNMIYLANDGGEYLNPSARLRKNDWNLLTSLSDHGLASAYKPRVERLIQQQRELSNA